jgi:hypothetical protein
MKRCFRVAAAALMMAGGLGSVGCAHRGGASRSAGDGAHGTYIDPSWPDRYNYAARQAVIAPFAQQVANGHFINQVLWTWYFEPGTDKLNGAGMEKLDSIARSTPAPDTKLYVQAARDVAVTAENVDKVAAMRNDLTVKRAAAIQRYLATQPGAPVTYEISVVDMPTPGIYAPFASRAFNGQTAGYRGGITGGVGGASGNVSGGGNITQSGTGAGAGAGSGAGAGAGTGTGTGY